MTPAEQPQAACSAGEAAARAGWSAVAEPGDPVLDALLRTYSAAQAWEAVRAGTPLPLPGTAVSTTAYRRWERWQACGAQRCLLCLPDDALLYRVQGISPDVLAAFGCAILADETLTHVWMQTGSPARGPYYCEAGQAAAVLPK